MSSLTVNTLTNQASQLCKAWVNFDANDTFTIRDSYRVASVTDNGTGDFNVNLSTPLSNTSYVVVGNARGLSTHGIFGAPLTDVPTVSSFRCRTNNSSTGANSDFLYNHIAVFGN